MDEVKNPSAADPSRLTLEEVDDYNQTVLALLAFGALVCFDGDTARPESFFGFGRRMTTGETNPVSPSTEVTPDLVAQRSATYGIVAEAKKTITRDEVRWHRYAQQLRKYDDRLLGWITPGESIAHSDTVMLIHQSRGRRFAQFLASLAAEDGTAVGPTTSVVEFNRSDEASPFLFFRREFGPINDSELQAALDEGFSIPLNKIKESYPNVRYYDAKPPLALLLTHLWVDVFPSYPSGDYDEKLRATPIEISLSSITAELQSAYGSGQLRKDRRSREFPKAAWIRDALDRLVAHRLALGPKGEDNDAYTVYYRRFRKDVLEHFTGLEHPSVERKGKKQRADTQMALFASAESNDE